MEPPHRSRGSQLVKLEPSREPGDMNVQTNPKDSDKETPVLPRYDALELTFGGNLAEIVLGDQVYRLRITKAGKLILTK